MARSPAVWMVTDSKGRPVAAFTVKHELCTWLWKFENPESIVHLRGWKVVDGYRHWVSKEKGGPWPLDLLYLRGLGEQAAAQKKIRDLWPKSWE